MTLPRIYRSTVTSLTGVCLVALILCSACLTDNRDREATQASLEDLLSDPLEFYAAPSPTTDPGEHGHLFDDISPNPADIVRAVQGVLVRVDVVENEGYAISARRTDREINIRTVWAMLDRIVELDDRPFTEARLEQNRLVSTCVQHAMLTTALFRHHGIPARARGGFEMYFSETMHHDHWITEYWDSESKRWVRVDAEITEDSWRRTGDELNGLDVSENHFLTGAAAWRMCRVGEKPPSYFGIWGGEWYSGWDFVLNELTCLYG